MTGHAALALMAAAPLLLAAVPLLPQHDPAAANTQASIGIDNFSFKDPVITVNAGTTVTWTNQDDIPHTVTADDGPPPTYRSHALDTGDKFSRLFSQKGTFHYFCSLHPKMRGTVIVR